MNDLKNKKILVLGIGPSQVDLIKKCKEYEMIVYAVAHKGEGLGREIADDFETIDIKDHSLVEEYARKNYVDCVFTVASEVGIKTTAIVSENLVLPHYVSSKSANILSKKHTWRAQLGDLEGNVDFVTGNELRDFANWDKYPAVIKPVDGSGQRGVYKVESYSDVVSSFSDSLQYSNLNQLMVEEYVDGPEVSVHSFMKDGELVFFMLSDRITYSEYPGGIIKEHRIPSKHTSAKTANKIRQIVEKVNQLSGLNDGPVYFQFKIDKNEPKIIEYTPRLDGCHMWRLIKLVTGIDLMDVSLQSLLSDKIFDLSYEIDADKTYYLKFISEKPGVLIDKANYFVPDNVDYHEWYYENGDSVGKVTGYMEKIAYYIVQE